MICASCKSEILANAAFCPSCGAKTGDASPTAPTMAGPGAPSAVQRTDSGDVMNPATEEEKWRGTFSAKSMAMDYVIWLIYVIAVSCLCFFVIPDSVTPADSASPGDSAMPSPSPSASAASTTTETAKAAEGWIDWLLNIFYQNKWWILVVGIGGVWLLYLLWTVFYRRLSLSYRLTNQRLFLDKGFMWRQTDEIELIRVDDIQVRQNPLQKMMNCGHVVVYSTDRTSPEFWLAGVDDPLEVKEQIRRFTHLLRRARGMFIERI
jgi:membrane protein YdbS with pleckstrin-like domain